MKSRLLIPILFYLTGCLFLGCQMFSPIVSHHTPLEEDDKINLALRQTAHTLYYIQGDSTTSIPPVIKVAKNRYSIKLNQSIRYDTLPIVLNKAIVDYTIKNDYQVAVSSCDKNEILLGYNLLSFKNRQVPCQSRDHQTECNVITLTLNEIKTSTDLFGYLSLLMISIGLISQLYPKFTLTKEMEAEFSLKPSLEVLSLAKSNFTPSNLLLIINGMEQTLTHREGKLLEMFFRNPNQILKRETIQDQVWGEEGVIVGRSLDVFVSRLRKILKEDECLSIKTVHGIGYRLEVIN